MPHRPRFSLLALALVLATLFGCGGGPTHPAPVRVDTPAAREADILGLLPPESEALTYVDVPSALESAHFATFRSVSFLDEPDIETLLRLAERTEVAALAVFRSPRHEEYLMVARGSYTEADIDSLQITGQSAPLRTHRIRVGSTECAAVLDGEFFVLGEEQAVRDAVDRYDGIAPANGIQTPGFTETSERVGLGEHDLSVIALGQFAREFVGEVIDRSAIPEGAATSAGASVDWRSGVAAAGFVQVGAEGAALTLLQALEAARAEFLPEARLHAPQLAAALVSLEITRAGDVLEACLELAPSAVEAILVEVSGRP